MRGPSGWRQARRQTGCVMLCLRSSFRRGLGPAVFGGAGGRGDVAEKTDIGAGSTFRIDRPSRRRRLRGPIRARATGREALFKVRCGFSGRLRVLVQEPRRESRTAFPSAAPQHVMSAGRTETRTRRAEGVARVKPCAADSFMSAAPTQPIPDSSGTRPGGTPPGTPSAPPRSTAA